MNGEDLGYVGEGYVGEDLGYVGRAVEGYFPSEKLLRTLFREQNNAPQRYLHPNPQNLKICYLLCKTNFADGVDLGF